jgi:hypothetical protein
MLLRSVANYTNATSLNRVAISSAWATAKTFAFGFYYLITILPFVRELYKDFKIIERNRFEYTLGKRKKQLLNYL